MMDPFRIGRWIAEPSLNQLTSGVQTVRLEPKVMRLLVCLAEANGAVVPRQQLIEEVWEGIHVVEGAVGRAVYQLRKALASGGGDENYIETVRQVGFRLAVDVKRVNSARPVTHRPFAAEPFRVRDVAFVFCAAVLVGGVALERMTPALQGVVAPAPVVALAPVDTAMLGERAFADQPPSLVPPAGNGLREERTAADEALRQERMTKRQTLQAERRAERQALLAERMAANRALREARAQERRERRGLMLAGAGLQAPPAPQPPPAPAPPEAPHPPEPEPPSPA